jgi:hypothetical protein
MKESTIDNFTTKQQKTCYMKCSAYIGRSPFHICGIAALEEKLGHLPKMSDVSKAEISTTNIPADCPNEY